MAYAGPEVGKARDRERFRRRTEERRAAGLCLRCGERSPTPKRPLCEPCADKRNKASRARDARLRAEGKPRRDPVREREYERERSRREAAARRARGLCTACGAPSQGASRCAPYAEKSYHRSDHFKGIPVWDPSWTVIELDTGREHGPFDSPEEVALCLAFEKLDRDRVEVVSNAPVTAALTGWI